MGPCLKFTSKSQSAAFKENREATCSGEGRGHFPGQAEPPPAVGGMGRATGGLTLVGCFQQHPPNLGRGEEGGCVLEKRWGSGNGKGIPQTR